MDLQACYELLAQRPAHAHAHCEGEHSHEAAEQAVNEVAAAVEASLRLGDDQVSVAALGRAFFEVQELRVHIYGEFQKGFEQFKATPQFQPFCTQITEQFAQVSQQVNAIETLLREKQRVALADLIRKVQGQEKEKLLLTSALAVERMRVTDMLTRPEPDAAILSLLEQSVAKMTAQHTEIIVTINELLDELRMELVDEMEE
ncbi:hypothetical protein Poli38472_005797 [Pythium oligandrum]|uniref:Uncharacterized protein n=1 Tax=Pythium oligandrum TaxID=41045 RepID=A0A8K1CSB0_PYTOL|nr:hypothetical protein Poli38472_005797 [Pythium oligandrum]|eukprot:TMW68329.1 hypothetical protein Poli38472_005797 [Pythium oligandrum]